VTPFADGVWFDSAPVSFLGLRVSANMTVLRLSDGGLLLYSPIPLTPERRAAVDALGPVKHVYSPNLWHHLRVGDWKAAYPAATLHAPKGLPKKRPDLKIDRLHDDAPIDPAVQELPLKGFMQERCMLHKPSRTLVVADVIANLGASDHWWTRAYMKTMGFYDRVGVSRIVKASFEATNVRTLLDHDWDALVVGHGTPLKTGGREALARVY
jgi:hypothetical protein